jgi:3-oxoacyl-ACP reductase-like protein/3-oxoacyl-(acyl-carrier-protein) synthase
VRECLLTLLALKTRVRLDEIRPDENIELLTGGNSSRRNQVMADLGNEFGIGSIDAAHEMPLGALVAAVEKATSGRYKAPGPFLRAQVTAALKPFGLSVKDVLSALSSRGLPEGRSLSMLNRAALWLRPGDSTRSGPLSPLPLPAAGDRGAAAGWIDAALARYAQEEGFSLSAGGGGGGGATVDAAALESLLGRYFGVGGAFLESLRFAEAALGRDVWAELEARALEVGTAPPSEESERLSRYDAEHGADYDKTIRPAFTTEKAVVYSGAWAWARRDAFALFHDLRAGRVSAADLPEIEARIARGADAAVSRTVGHLERRARRQGDTATAEVFARLGAAIDPTRIPTARSEAVPLAPAVEILPDGRLSFSEKLRGEPTAVAVARELIDGRQVALGVHGAPQPAENERAHGLFAASIDALARGEATFAGRTALVTGASERSIAIELVKLLLTGGARVVVTTSNLTPERVKFYRRLFQLHGARGAELAVVPFNQGSRQDIQRLVNWLVSTEKTTVGGTQRTVKEPWLVDLLVPFGAVGEEATLAEISDRSMATLRVLLYGVEALVAECAQAFSRLHVHESRTHVLLPLSPNHGQFGNDGFYGETKAALEAMLNRWSSEHAAWGRHASLVGARIGWVRGTGLMNVNNAIAPGLEHTAGVRTFSSAEMGLLLGALCAEPIRALAAEVPLVADLTGGMAAVRDLAGVARRLRAGITADLNRTRRRHQLRREEAKALGRVPAETRRVEPAPRFGDHFAFPPLPAPARRAALCDLRHLDLSRVAVLVGLGEVGPWGSARTRWSMESTGELSLEACVELAWLTGRIRYEKNRNHVGFVDAASGEPIREQDVKTRYEAALLEDAGIRIVDPAMQNGFDPRKMKVWADVVLERDFVFPVPGQAEGQAFVDAAGDGARLIFDPEKDGFFVVRKKGSIVKVARAARLNRYVAGQIPKGWDAVRFGIPRDMADQVDRTTLFNLVATVEAFLSAGMEPEELYRYLHPSDVGNTQGAGIGGMQKLERLYLDHPLDRPRQGDALQETLINVTAAWIVQTLVGSYGPMVHPVGACATAAVSVEEAVDKVLGGKAAFIVAGGFDDYGEEGAVGFADMAATADTDDMLARGIPPREMSRPNDRRRRGFVEAQGGGTMLVCRGDVAIRMGLPIYAAVALARSYGDGIHRSIPAPGPGVMAVAAERRPRNGEATGAQLCDLDTRLAEWQRVQGLFTTLRNTLGEPAAQRFEAAERRRLFHDIQSGDERISPLRRALAVFGLGPDDVAAAWKHDTSTDANDPNENRAYDRIMRWLGREAGNPLVVVSQKSLTGHSKGGAAAWQAAGLCQAMATGRVPGNQNLDDPDPAMRAYETVLFTDRPIDIGPGHIEAGIVTSLGFGHVGAILCLVHPDRVLAALDDAAYTAYATRRDARERSRLREQLSVLESARPAVRIRTDKAFQVPADAAYAGFDAEHAVLLDAASRRLDDTGPIVAGGVAEGLAGPEAEQAAPSEV